MATRQDHGHTPAAWATVLIVLAGIFLGAVAVAITNWPLFWVSVGVIVLGGIVGKVMQMMGMGKNISDASSDAGQSGQPPGAPGQHAVAEVPAHAPERDR